MKPEFFKYKMKEVGNFLKIFRGKITGNKRDRIEGVDDALKATREEQKIYLDEKQHALNEQQPEAGQDKVLRKSGGQDISSI